MDKAAKRVVCAYGAAGVLSQLLFGFIYFAMRDEFVFAPNLRKLTYEEFDWVVQHPGSHSEILTDCCYVLGGILLCVVAAGVVHLLVQRDSVLPIRGRWKLILPLGGFVAAALCCYAAVHRAEHLRMYMEFLPLEFASLVLLGLLLAGLLARRQHELRR